MTTPGKKVLLGMSGGVDSSVAALLLRDAGYDVMGVTLRLRPDALMAQSSAGGCCSLDDIDDARRVAYRLGLEHVVMNFEELFRRDVIDGFAAEYAAGRTPNPCIACNRHIKFDAMLRRARELGYDYIATGHYGVIERDGRWLLRMAPDKTKDQSYVLYTLTQDQLAHTLMPLGRMTKAEARAMAASAGLPVAHKPDSQEICFVENNDYAAFLRAYTGKEPEPGDFVDAAGAVIGRHNGVEHYTIGQRKGLGGGFAAPMYVIGIDAPNNRITLGGEGSQYAAALTCGELNWVSVAAPEEPLRVEARVRYQAKPAPALLTPLGDGCARVEFDAPQRAVTPGQAVVFYEGDLVLGGGTIGAA